MKNVLILLVVTFYHTSSFSQIFILGDKSYPSTKTFTLIANSNTGEDLNVSIAKKKEGGMIVLKTEILGGDSEWCRHRIKGNIIIYLDNGKVIKCLDRKKYDSVDGYITTIYYLTNSELLELKLSNINTIRYTIKTIPNSCSSSQEGSFSASNVIGKYGSKREDIPLELKSKF